MIKLLCLGDVVGEEGVSFLESGGRLRKLKQKYGADLVIVNGENSAKGNGITPLSAERLYDAGADIITGGNHTFRRREVYNLLTMPTTLFVLQTILRKCPVWVT